MAIGGIVANGAGSVQFNPASGTATFTGLNIAPIINQTSSASGSYTALNIAVTETSLKGTANLLINASAGTAGTTSEFAINNTGLAVVYGQQPTVKRGLAAILDTSVLTAQASAISGQGLVASTPAVGKNSIKRGGK